MIENRRDPVATLALADGTVYRGLAFGATSVVTGEICFNTSMTGYQEILTDPSYAGQIVTMTCPHIGNVGVNVDDTEGARPFLSAFVAKEICERPSNWRSQGNLADYLAQNGIPGLEGIDTRALVRHIRDFGFQNGTLSTDSSQQDEVKLIDRARCAPSLGDRDLVSEVTCQTPYVWTEGLWPGIKGELSRSYDSNISPDLRLVVYDFGVKRNILRLLVEHGFEVTVVPARTDIRLIRDLSPDAVFLSNGPGDPNSLGDILGNIKEVCRAYPTFGICLGHQMLSLSLGGKTKKLKFGHHGGNQPTQDRLTGRVAICAENHGYAVDIESLQQFRDQVEVTHINLNDGVLEGLAHRLLPVFSVQYHPEASPGPHDANYFFSRFRNMVMRSKAGENVSGYDIARGG